MEIQATCWARITRPCSTPSALSRVRLVRGSRSARSGYIDIPASTSLANQQLTLSAWARPDGAGPTSDSDGNVIITQNIDNFTTLALTWRAIDNHFLFSSVSILREVVSSRDSFEPGQFYLVTGTYDGATFKLYVNGALEAEMAKVKTLGYSTNAWTIGAASPNIRSQASADFQRCDRRGSGIQSCAFSRRNRGIYFSGNRGECKAPVAIGSAVPNVGQQGGAEPLGVHRPASSRTLCRV